MYIVNGNSALLALSWRCIDLHMYALQITKKSYTTAHIGMPHVMLTRVISWIPTVFSILSLIINQYPLFTPKSKHFSGLFFISNQFNNNPMHVIFWPVDNGRACIATNHGHAYLSKAFSFNLLGCEEVILLNCILITVIMVFVIYNTMKHSLGLFSAIYYNAFNS